MTEQVFTLPDLGEGLTEAQIVEWKVQEGDTVAVDQLVVEVILKRAQEFRRGRVQNARGHGGHYRDHRDPGVDPSW